jgi:hypothetical protein
VTEPLPVSMEPERLPIIDYARHPAYGGAFEPDPALRLRALEILQPLIQQMRELEAWKSEVFGYRYGHDGAVGETLARDGLVRFQLPARLIDPIGAGAEPLLATIAARLADMRSAEQIVRFSDRLEMVEQASHPDLYAAIDAMLRDIGAYELTQRYFNGLGAKLKSAAVLVSLPERDGPDHKLRADGDTPPAEGLHIDSAGRCLIKAVLYLKDVGPDQGPFGMLPGSHRWEAGSEGRVLRRAFDRSSLTARGKKERRLFVSLPKELQLKAEFGGDMLPEWPLTRELLGREDASIGPRGLLSLFDPEAIHRGGQARVGERHAMLLTLRPVY